jgi:hypothetical protein
MKRFLLAGASLLALLAGSPAEAATLVFGYTGAIVPYVVPETGTYQIIAWGAEGGGSPGSAVGGLGAEIGGDVSLLANTRLEILVGQMGASGKEKYAGGGGGGSFVFLKIGEPPLIAAGGGGAGAPGRRRTRTRGRTGTTAGPSAAAPTALAWSSTGGREDTAAAGAPAAAPIRQAAAARAQAHLAAAPMELAAL